MKSYAHVIVAAGSVTLIAIASACSSSDDSTSSSSSSGTSGAPTGTSGTSGTQTGTSGGDGTSSGTSGTSSSGDAGGDGSLASGLDPTKLIAALCDYKSRCDVVGLNAQFGDVATCKTVLDATYNKAPKAPGITKATADLDACAAEYTAAKCTDNLDAVTPHCTFKGTLAVAVACDFDEQCTTGLCFYPTLDATCGACAARLAIGADCGVTKPDCVTGSYCADDTSKCVAFLAKGTECSDATALCDSGLACINGHCADLLAVGADCNPDEAQCTFNAECAEATSKCVASPPAKFANIGEKCGLDDETGTNTFCKAARCDTGAVGGAKCAAFLADGAECDPDVAEQCMVNHDCDRTTMKCTAPGEPSTFCH